MLIVLAMSSWLDHSDPSIQLTAGGPRREKLRHIIRRLPSWMDSVYSGKEISKLVNAGSSKEVKGDSATKLSQ